MSNRMTIDGGTAEKAAGAVSAVVLAAGESRRMDPDNKLLSEIDGTALVRLSVQAAAGSRVAEVIVVTGFEAEKIRDALAGLDVRFVHNPDYREGLSTSLGAGIGAVAAGHSGAVVLLGDMPRVTAAVIDALIARFHAEGASTICRPAFGGRPGNPVLWPRPLFFDIQEIRGDTGARSLLKTYSGRVSEVEVDAPGIHFDIDTPEDINQNDTSPEDS